MKVREAGKAERTQVLGLWLGLIEHHERLLPDASGLPRLRQRLLREIDRGVRSPGCRVLLVDSELRPGPAGFAFVEVSGRGTQAIRGEIHELFVEPGCRGQGGARALLEAAQAFFAEQGATSTVVRVESENPEALAFWRRQGFEERARILVREAPR